MARSQTGSVLTPGNRPLSAVKLRRATPIWRMLAVVTDWFADFFIRPATEKTTTARTMMMVITMRTSIRVNPRREDGLAFMGFGMVSVNGLLVARFGR